MACSGAEPFTFDRSALAGARAARADRTAVRELVPDAAAGRRAVASATSSLADLHDFFAHPVRGFFRGGCASPRPTTPTRSRTPIPIVLDALEQWAVGDRLVGDVLAGADPQTAMVAEQLRGLLPPGELGVGVLN